MLAFGCGDVDCKYKLCKSCSTCKKIDLQMASAVAVSLASKPVVMLCPKVQVMKQEEIEKCMNLVLHDKAHPTERSISSFLPKMMSFTSLSRIFNQESSVVSKDSTQARSQSSFSQNDLRNFLLPIDKTLSKHLDYSTTIPDYLKNSDWQQLFSEYKNSGNSRQLVDCLNTIYSSRTRLGRCFMEEANPSALDLNSLDLFYDKLFQLDENEVLENVISNAIEILLSKLSQMPSIESPTHTRALLIMLYNPRLNELVVRKFSLLVDKFSHVSRSLLVYWFDKFPKFKFESIITMFREFVLSHYYPGPENDNSVVCALKIMAILFESNQISKKISISAFYIPEISQTLNFKKEHSFWKDPKSAKFSFFKYPFIFDPIAKTRIMHIDALFQMSGAFEEAYVSQALVFHAQKFLEYNKQLSDLEKKMHTAANVFLVLEIRRESMIEDTIEQLRKKFLDLKKPIKVRFIDGGEVGMDQGGVQKEFFQLIISELLDPTYGLFVYDEQTRYSWFNPEATKGDMYFELLGILIGLAVYNGIILGISFASVFYKKLLDEKVEFYDFVQAFPQLGEGLQQLLNWDEGNVEEIFQRSFEISYQHLGKIKSKSLIPNGENIPVTNENRKEFVDKYVKYYLDESTERQFIALKKGLLRIYGRASLQICQSCELEMIICGQNSDNYNFQELQEIAKYDDGYGADCQIISWFWEIIKSFSLDHKKKLLTFVTASDRIPLNGLKSLTFVIQRNGPDSDRLPTALTCFGRLLLPDYNTKEKLEKLLIIAIENASGFGLI